MAIGWRRRRRLRRLSRAFCHILERQGVPAALDHFTAKLAPDAMLVSLPMQALYHLHGWLQQPDERHVRGLRDLATAARGYSDVPLALEAVRWLARLRVLTQLVRSRDWSKASLVGAPEVSSDDEIAELEALERLALSVLLAFGASRSDPVISQADVARLAAEVLAALPSQKALLGHLRRQDEWQGETPASSAAKDEPAAPRLLGVAAHLRAWAALTSDVADVLPLLEEAAPHLAPAQQTQARSVALQLTGLRSVAGNDLRRAADALQKVVEASGSEHAHRIAVGWGVAALGKTPQQAMAWFESLTVAKPSSRELDVARLGGAIAAMRAGNAAKARETLAGLTGQQAAAPDADGAQPGSGGGAIRAAALLLSALSLIAATRDWTAPGSERDAAMEIRVKNRGLWVALKARIDPIIEQLKAEPAPWSSWAFMLAGLMTYADREGRVDKAMLEGFSAAIESVTGADAKRRFYEIEATLVSRAMAVEQAIELITNGRHQQLADFKQTVLDRSGAPIPSLVRAAVAMTLWLNTRDYDPMPDLMRIEGAAAEEALIARCIEEVSLVRGLRRLGALCTGRDPLEGAPPLERFAAGGDECMQLAQLALSVAHLSRRDFQTAAQILANLPDQPERERDIARFQVAWQAGDGALCQSLIETGRVQPRHTDGAAFSKAAVTGLAIVKALGAGDSEQAWTLLAYFADGSQPDKDPTDTIAAIVVWLLRRGRAQDAMRLLESGWHAVQSQVSPSDAAFRFGWACAALAPVAAAAAGQYASCVASADRLFGLPRPPEPAFKSIERDGLLVGWCRLLRVAAELGLTAETAGPDWQVRWRAVQRALDDQRLQMQTLAPLRPYAGLLTGMFMVLTSDAPVETSALENLSEAQRGLQLKNRAAFVDTVIGRLKWRQQVLEDFWSAVGSGNPTRARLIHEQELRPVFGLRMPSTIALAMIVLDWSSGGADVEDSVRRLDGLAQSALDLPAELIANARAQMEEGRTLRFVTRLLREQQFTRVIETLDQTNWVGMQRGEMPIPAAVALLFAYFKTRNIELTEKMAAGLNAPDRFADWVGDYSALLLGYVQFDNKEYPKAAETLGRIRVSTLLGHDTDQYWAASQFNHGLQLMAVDQKEKAFEVLSGALARRGGVANAQGLAGLFLHFGLKALDKGQGRRAAQAFELAAESLNNASDSAEIAAQRLAAGLGRLLCAALMSEDNDEVSGETFLATLDQLAELGTELTPERRAKYERAIRILAICQELRRFQRGPEGGRKTTRLRDFLRQQLAGLEPLEPALGSHDPVARVLTGLINLKLGGGRRAAALAELGEIVEAMKLGVNAPRLMELLDKERKEVGTLIEKNATALDLLDLHLTSGSLTADHTDRLVRDHELAELYRLNRGYVPADIVTSPKGPVGLKAFRDRISRLIDFAAKEPLSTDEEVVPLKASLQRLIEEVEASEQEILSIERRMMDKVAMALKSQSLERL